MTFVGRPPSFQFCQSWLTDEKVWCRDIKLFVVAHLPIWSPCWLFLRWIWMLFHLLLLSFHWCSPPLILLLLLLLLHHSKSAITNCRQIAGVEREEGTLSFFFPFHFFSLYHLTRVTWWTTSTDAPTELRARENWMLLLSPCYQFSLLACHLVVTSSSCFSIPLQGKGSKWRWGTRCPANCVWCADWCCCYLHRHQLEHLSTELEVEVELNFDLSLLFSPFHSHYSLLLFLPWTRTQRSNCFFSFFL